MATAATISARLLLNSKDFQQGMDNAESKAKSFQSKMQSVGKKMTKVGGAMTAGLTAPIVAGGVAMVDAASSYKESMGAVETIFGDAGDTVTDFAETSADAVALSGGEFMHLASVSGSLLQNLGYSAEDAADETIALTERASDMAAVFDTDVSQALEAVQSGLKGEMNPLEQFGVKLNAASVKAKALSMGLAETNVSMVDVEAAQLKVEKSMTKYAEAVQEHGQNSLEAREAANKLAKAEEKLEDALAGDTAALSDNAKAQATLALLMEQTERISGTFAREQEGVAGSLKTVKAQLKSQAEILGQELLPYVAEFLGHISKLIEKFAALTPEQKKNILTIVGIVAAAGPLLIILGQLVGAFGSIIGVVGTVAGGGGLLALLGPIAAVGAAVGGLWLAWKNNLGDIQGKVKSFVSNVKKRLQGIDFGAAFEKVKEKFSEFLKGDFAGAGKTALKVALPIIFGPIGRIGSVIMGLIGGKGIDMKQFFDLQSLEKVKTAIRGVFDVLVKGDFTGEFGEALGITEDSKIIDALFTIREGITGAIDFIKGKLGKLNFSKVGGKIKVLWAVLKTGFIVIKDIAISIGKTLWPAIKRLGKAFKENGPAIKSLMTSLWTVLKPILIALGALFIWALSVITSVLTGIMDGIGMALPYLIKAFEGVVTFVGGLINTLKGLAQIIVGIFTLDWEMIKSGFINLFKGLFNIFKGAWEMLEGVVGGALMFIIGLIGGFVNGTIEFFKNLYHELVGGSIIPDMLNAIRDFFKLFSSKVLQIIRDFIAGIISKWTNGMSRLKKATKKAADYLRSKIKGAIDSIKKAVGGLMDKLGGLKDKFGGLELPDWMTPGSPTPLELGLRGINKEMSLLSRKEMPQLGDAPIGGLGGGATQNTSNKTINVTVNNPREKTTEDSVNREMNKLAYLGII